VDTTGDVGHRPSLALDTAGHPHICYTDTTNQRIKYARWTGSVWDIQTFDTGPGTLDNCAIAVDSAGKAYISYTNSLTGFVGAKYARWTGTDWLLQHVGDAVASLPTSTALGTNDVPYIAYVRPSTGNLIRWSQPSGNSWAGQEVGSGNYASIKLYTGLMRIAFAGITAVKFAISSGPGWSVENVDTTTAGGIVRTALDAAGTAHVVYEVPGRTVLAKYAYRPSPNTWASALVSATLDGSSPAIALDASGKPHVVFGGATVYWAR
jgi:hypothetical protein